MSATVDDFEESDGVSTDLKDRQKLASSILLKKPSLA
jgi:hypothetical protein